MPMRRFPRRPSLHAATATLLLVAGAGACERKPSAVRADSTAPAAAATADAARPARDQSGWNPAAGPALLVQGATTDEAIVLFPFADDTLDEAQLDSASMDEGTAALFGRGGVRFAARLGALPDDTESACERWLLRDVHPVGTGSAWAIGFVDARVDPVPLDSVELLSPRDSLALAAEASRLASAVTAPTSPSFQGLRFTAHDIRRFSAAPGVQALVAHLIRHVNQEANPLEEQTLIIAERDSGSTSGPYRLVYAERSFGREEQVATPEVLAGVRLGGSPHPTLVIAREGESGIIYAFVERTGPKRWQARWTSAASECR